VLVIGNPAADNADDGLGDIEMLTFIPALTIIFVIHDHRCMHDIEMLGDNRNQVLTDIQYCDLTAGA
jgi:hypothetical protein